MRPLRALYFLTRMDVSYGDKGLNISEMIYFLCTMEKIVCLPQNQERIIFYLLFPLDDRNIRDIKQLQGGTQWLKKY